MVKLALALLFCALPAFAQDVLVEADLAPAEVYVQAQAVYRLRFLHAIDVRDVQFAEPAVRLADLRALGPERVYEAQRGGRRYRVHERSFAVFPFSSGTLELAGAHVTGRNASGRALQLDAPARSLTVLPEPVGMDRAHWLPAESLALSEEWQTQANGVYRRTIRIEATGVQAAQLPEAIVVADGMGVLAESPVLHNRIDGDRNIASREQAFVMMPERPGLAKVPVLQMHWWRTDTRAPALATLPARTVLLGEPGTPAPATPAPSSELASMTFGHMLIAASLILLLVLLFLRSDRARHAWQLHRACRAADPHLVRDALLAWSAGIWPDSPHTLAALAQRLDNHPAAEGARRLERSLYGPERATWTPDALAGIVANIQRAARRSHQPDQEQQ